MEISSCEGYGDEGGTISMSLYLVVRLCCISAFFLKEVLERSGQGRGSSGLPSSPERVRGRWRGALRSTIEIRSVVRDDEEDAGAMKRGEDRTLGVMKRALVTGEGAREIAKPFGGGSAARPREIAKPFGEGSPPFAFSLADGVADTIIDEHLYRIGTLLGYGVVCLPVFMMMLGMCEILGQSTPSSLLHLSDSSTCDRYHD
ncbi:hypothetical protein ACLOJK_008045 [Asimina triloba]